MTLTGPVTLDRLDEVTIVILDEDGVNHWGHGYSAGVSEEEARLFVWGPWEFNTGASAQVTDNRTTRPRSYSLADGQNRDHLSPDAHPAGPLDGHDPGTVAEADDRPYPAAAHCPPRRRPLGPPTRSRALRLTAAAVSKAAGEMASAS